MRKRVCAFFVRKSLFPVILFAYALDGGIEKGLLSVP